MNPQDYVGPRTNFRVLSVRLPPDLLDCLKKDADEHFRSMNAQLAAILAQRYQTREIGLSRIAKGITS